MKSDGKICGKHNLNHAGVNSWEIRRISCYTLDLLMSMETHSDGIFEAFMFVKVLENS